MSTDWAALDRDTNDTIVAVAIDKYGMLAAFTTRPVYYEVSGKWVPLANGKRYNLGLTGVSDRHEPQATLTIREGTEATLAKQLVEQPVAVRIPNEQVYLSSVEQLAPKADNVPYEKKV